jgi:hydroxypyruvate isomerase
MNRRDFIATGLASSAAVVAGATNVKSFNEQAGQVKRKYKLRYAPHLSILARELTIPQRLELIAEHGFDATEYNGLLNHPLNEVEEIRKKMDSLGIEMGIFVANPGGWQKAGLVDPKQRDNFLTEIKKTIEYHKVIGNKSVTTLTGPALPGVSRSSQRRSAIEGLKRAAELLEKTDLALVVEPLNHIDHPGFFMTHSDELAEIIAAVNSKNARMLFDLYHLQITEGNLINNFRAYVDLIGYVQTGDVPGRKEPGTGEVNYRNIFKAIYDAGYRGIIGMEHGTSLPGREGVLKMFDAYKQADNWELKP